MTFNIEDAYNARKPYVVSQRTNSRVQAPSELERRIEGPTSPINPQSMVMNSQKKQYALSPLTSHGEALEYARKVADKILCEGRYNAGKIKF